MNLSAHPALIAQPVPEEIASEQTVSIGSAVFALAIDMLYAGVSSVSYIPSLLTSPVFDQGGQMSGALPICSSS